MRTLVRHVAQRLKRTRPTASAGTGGFLTRLRSDKTGNMLALTAAAIFPLLAMVGGGLDLSRAYLVRTRLQQACDAGVLAGRRLMGSGGSLTDPVKAEMAKYIAFNFPDKAYQTSTIVQQPTLTDATGTINLTLSTAMNTAIMRIFNRPTVDVSVKCSARDDYANIDIMLVLDTTGSMACKPSRDAYDCGNFVQSRKYSTTVNGKSVPYYLEETDGTGNISRMQALRNALSSLQTQMAQIETNFNTAPVGSRKRIRWSVVPFSMMVNPGMATDSAGRTLYDRNPGGSTAPGHTQNKG